MFERDVPARALFAELAARSERAAALAWRAGARSVDAAVPRGRARAGPHDLPRGGAAVFGVQRPRRGTRRARCRWPAAGTSRRCGRPSSVSRWRRPPTSSAGCSRATAGGSPCSSIWSRRCPSPSAFRDRRVDGRRRASPRSVPGPLRARCRAATPIGPRRPPRSSDIPPTRGCCCAAWWPARHRRQRAGRSAAAPILGARVRGRLA